MSMEGKCCRIPKWKHLVKKIDNFENHRRFTMTYLSQDIMPVSLKPKNNNIRIPQNIKIIRKGEKQLMNG